jgi:hypothetical protein
MMNINLFIGILSSMVVFHMEKANASIGISTSCYSKIEIKVEYTEVPLSYSHTQLFSEVVDYTEDFKKDLDRLSISGSYQAQASVFKVVSVSAKATFAYDKLTNKVRHSKRFHSEKIIDTKNLGFQKNTKLRIRTTTTTVTINGRSGTVVEQIIHGHGSTNDDTDYAKLRRDGERDSTPPTCLIPCSAGCNLCHTCRRNKVNENALIVSVSEGDINQVERLVKMVYIHAKASPSSASGATALFAAALGGHRNIAKVLLAHGANPKEIVCLKGGFIMFETCVSTCDYNNKIGYIMNC